MTLSLMVDAFVWLKIVLDQDPALVVAQGQDPAHDPGGLVHAQGHGPEVALVLAGHEDHAPSHVPGLGRGTHGHALDQGHDHGHAQDLVPNHDHAQDQNPMMQRDQSLESVTVAQDRVHARSLQNLLAILRKTTQFEMSSGAFLGPDHGRL